MNNTRGFLYHAYALGISGRLGDQVITPQAASALPPAGGLSSAQWSHYQLQDLVKYDTVSSSTEGVDRGDEHHVTAKAAIGNLRVGNLFRGDFSVQLEAAHDSRAEAAPRFSLVPGSTFLKNVSVAGRPLKLTPLFPGERSTTAGVRDRYVETMARVRGPAALTPIAPDLVGAVRRVFAWFRHECRKGEPPAYNDVTVLPLFRVENPTEAEKFIVEGNLIHVPGAGWVQLGQLILRNNEWRVTMVQVHLGDIKPPSMPGPRLPGISGGSSGGSVSGGSVGTNGGHTDPP